MIEITIPDMPKPDYLIENDYEKMDYYAIKYYTLLYKIEETVYTLLRSNAAFHQSINGAAQQCLLSEILVALSKLHNDNECKRPEYEKVDYSEFLQIAFDSYKALKHIINDPSSNVKRRVVMQHYTKVKVFDSKCIQWLAEQPETEIFAKLRPNKTMKSKEIYFSYDTLENRFARYFYNKLHSNLNNSYMSSGCYNCEEECDTKKKMLQFLGLKKKIENSNINSAIPDRIIYPNNTLVENKYYSQLWKKNSAISSYRNNMSKMWDTLPMRLGQINLMLKVICYINDGWQVVDKVVKFYKDFKDENQSKIGIYDELDGRIVTSINVIKDGVIKAIDISDLTM